MAKAPIEQPKFDSRIYGLRFPLQGSKFGSLKRGFMIWDKSIPGFSNRATVHFLYNPSTVQADYALSDASVGASLLFPNPGDKIDLRVPLQQTASWSILYDRTYELWGAYDDSGTARASIGKDKNNPAVIGVLADIFQMQQFTGMTVGYTGGGATTTGSSSSTFAGHQGILQLIPSWVYFGNKDNLSFYGYITEWDVQVTHWTQYMVPMRCVIDITWTMLPPPNNVVTPAPTNQNQWSILPKLGQLAPSGPAGKSGR